MPPKIFWCFRALRELKLLVQSEANSEANSYSTAIENHDFMLWPTCCMKLKCIVGHQNQAFVPLPGSAFAFLVVLHAQEFRPVKSHSLGV